MLSRKIKKITIASMMAVMLTMSTQGIAAEAASNQLKAKTIYINDQAVTTTVIDQHGYQLVPASLFRQIGATVKWDSAAKTPEISNGNIQVKLPIGLNTAYYNVTGANQWKTDANLKTRTTLIKGTSYVPLAYTAKKLGIDVQYDVQLRAAKLLVELNSNTSLHALSAKTQEQPNKIAGSKQLSADDLYWLYRLTEAEAGGESYEGKVAVAATVLNRVETEGWPNTVVDTVFEVVVVNGKSYYQFEPVLNKYIYKVTPSEETKKAVQAAINGEDPTNGAVVFYNPDKTANKWVLSRPVSVTIGGHVFAL